MRTTASLLLILLLAASTACKKKSSDEPEVHPGYYTYQGFTYNLDKCYLVNYPAKGSIYRLSVWFVSSGIAFDATAPLLFSGKGDYVSFNVFTSDSSLTAGSYVFADTKEAMTWDEGDFAHPFDFNKGEGNWARMIDGVMNTSIQGKIYTFDFTTLSERGYELKGAFSGEVILKEMTP